MSEEQENVGLLAETNEPPGYDDVYMPGPPPDYFTSLNMDEYGPPQYQEPTVEGLNIGKGDQETGTSGLPRLSYVDFLPYCFRPGDKETGRLPVFDSFKGLINFANTWLAQNRHYTGLHIESIEVRVGHDGQFVEDGRTIEHFSAYGGNGLLRGIRLWLVPSSDTLAPPQKLAFFNWLPEYDPIEQEVYVSHGGRRSHIMSKHTIEYPNFKDLTVTLDALNTCLVTNPIPGTVKAVQTMELLFQESWGKRCIDPDKSCYFSFANKAHLFLQYVRIFYIQGPPVVQTIDLVDFVPEVAFKGKMSYAKPRFEEFKQVFQRASSWIYQNDAKTVRVLSIQNVDMKCDWMKMLHCVAGETIVDPKVTWYHEVSETVFVRTMRVACVRLDKPENRSPLTLTSRLFVPVRTAAKSAENVPQTVGRINTWLDLAHVPVCSVTTQKFLFEPESKVSVKPEESSYKLQKGRGVYMVTALRLFLGGHFEEPDPMPLHPSNTAEASSCCVLV